MDTLIKVFGGLFCIVLIAYFVIAVIAIILHGGRSGRDKFICIGWLAAIHVQLLAEDASLSSPLREIWQIVSSSIR